MKKYVLKQPNNPIRKQPKKLKASENKYALRLHLQDHIVGNESSTITTSPPRRRKKISGCTYLIPLCVNT